MIENSPWLIFPPLLAISYSIIFKKAGQGLSLGILAAVIMISNFSPVSSLSLLWSETLKILSSPGSMYVLGFTILIGIMMEFIHATKADQSFINLISTRFGVNTPTKARFVPLFIGSLIFTDTNLSIVSSGISSRSLFDRFKIPRQVLAFIVDATCAPVSVLVLLNGWGAYISQLLATMGLMIQ